MSAKLGMGIDFLSAVASAVILLLYFSVRFALGCPVRAAVYAERSSLLTDGHGRKTKLLNIEHGPTCAHGVDQTTRIMAVVASGYVNDGTSHFLHSLKIWAQGQASGILLIDFLTTMETMNRVTVDGPRWCGNCATRGAMSGCGTKAIAAYLLMQLLPKDSLLNWREIVRNEDGQMPVCSIRLSRRVGMIDPPARYIAAHFKHH